MAFRKLIDLTGQRFGKLVVFARTGSQAGHALWKCTCDCGNETTATGSNLTKGGVTSCGCVNKELAREKGVASRSDLTNQKFGRLTVSGYAGVDEHHHTLWTCTCECGNEKTVIHKVV
jgi:hypothetical protein